MTNTPTVLEAHGISKSFEDGKQKLSVLHNISFSLHRAETVAIMGRSGSGKSTLLHILGGLSPPSKGDVRISEKSFYKLSDQKRSLFRNQHIGFIFQFHHLLPELTALENIAIPLLLRGKSTAKAQQEALTMLKQVDLLDRASHKPAQLSGGERQRVAIARAMITRPACLLADEPTGNLDLENAKAALDFIKRLSEDSGMAVIMVTHALELAEHMQKRWSLQNGTLHT